MLSNGVASIPEARKIFYGRQACTHWRGADRHGPRSAAHPGARNRIVRTSGRSSRSNPKLLSPLAQISLICADGVKLLDPFRPPHHPLSTGYLSIDRHICPWLHVLRQVRFRRPRSRPRPAAPPSHFATSLPVIRLLLPAARPQCAKRVLPIRMNRIPPAATYAGSNPMTGNYSAYHVAFFPEE
jgi:hypothetical protein